MTTRQFTVRSVLLWLALTLPAQMYGCKIPWQIAPGREGEYREFMRECSTHKAYHDCRWNAYYLGLLVDE